MALTNVRRNFPPATQRASGYLSGTYTAASVTSETTASATCSAEAAASITIASGVMTIALGFVPRYFRIRNCTDRLTQEWHEGMNQGDFLETVANGTQTLETDDQVTITVADTGSAPVAVKPTALVTVIFAGGAVTDNDTVVWEAVG